MSTKPKDARDDQILWLVDKLALSLAFITDVELDVQFEQDTSEPNRFSEAHHMIMSECEHFEKLRELKRKTVFYEEERAAIRAKIVSMLQGKARKAA